MLGFYGGTVYDITPFGYIFVFIWQRFIYLLKIVISILGDDYVTDCAVKWGMSQFQWRITY